WRRGRRQGLQGACRPDAAVPPRQALRARRPLARRAGGGGGDDPLRGDEAPARAGRGRSRRHTPAGPGEAAFPQSRADSADPRPVDRQVHRAPRVGARRPQDATGGNCMTTMTEVQTTQVYQVYVKATPEAVWDAITKP